MLGFVVLGATDFGAITRELLLNIANIIVMLRTDLHFYFQCKNGFTFENQLPKLR